MKVGEICWVEFPARGGRAQAGRRPAVIVQADFSLPTILMIPLTTQRDALRFAGTVLVEPDLGNKLRQQSVALVFQLTSVDRSFVKNTIGTLSDLKIDEMFDNLDQLMGRSRR